MQDYYTYMSDDVGASELNQILSQFGIKASCVDSKNYKTLSTYDLKLVPGYKLSKLNSYSKELALALKAYSEIEIESVPSEGIVRLKVKTAKTQLIDFNSIYNKNFKPKTGMNFLLGRKENNENLWVDFSDNPHMLIAGATGSGKTVLLHNIIANSLTFNNIDLFLVDTKNVEFNGYKNAKTQLVSDYNSTVNMIEFLIEKMESRYKLFSQLGISNLSEKPALFNKSVVIIDEVSDLMLADKKTGRFEKSLIRLAQKSRAAGIHLVLATQRPSYDILTGLIKANFPARIACKVMSRTDSSIILDHKGAELLEGKGDAIIKSAAYNSVRFQVAQVKVN